MLNSSSTDSEISQHESCTHPALWLTFQHFLGAHQRIWAALQFGIQTNLQNLWSKLRQRLVSLLPTILKKTKSNLVWSACLVMAVRQCLPPWYINLFYFPVTKFHSSVGSPPLYLNSASMLWFYLCMWPTTRTGEERICICTMSSYTQLPSSQQSSSAPVPSRKTPPAPPLLARTGERAPERNVVVSSIEWEDMTVQY